ncbi:TcpQ domain-containing protein [Aestuariibacter salexigens]|uniref:TcpQ domain-containing protein n=1 Tax=Aestuariibacter salexigens TaxID=226010 RepID=UPI00040EBED8|nr:TcpQ domain-containing protein [Aestuariibacter salexigens]
MTADKGFSSSLFWAKHLALALALIIIAVVIIQLRSTITDKPQPQGAPEKKNVSQGLSDFYREYRLSSTKPHQEDVGDFVMDVNVDDRPLDQRLQGMQSDQKPVSGRWVGEHKYRTFKAGSTLRSAITSFAQTEGMQVLWELEQDFIVKNQFQMDDTIVGALAKIASAVDSNFEGEVRAYVCPNQRSLVITHNHTDYLKDNCTIIEKSGRAG